MSDLRLKLFTLVSSSFLLFFPFFLLLFPFSFPSPIPSFVLQHLWSTLLWVLISHDVYAKYLRIPGRLCTKVCTPARWAPVASVKNVLNACSVRKVRENKREERRRSCWQLGDANRVKRGNTIGFLYILCITFCSGFFFFSNSKRIVLSFDLPYSELCGVSIRERGLLFAFIVALIVIEREYPRLFFSRYSGGWPAVLHCYLLFLCCCCVRAPILPAGSSSRPGVSSCVFSQWIDGRTSTSNLHPARRPSESVALSLLVFIMRVALCSNVCVRLLFLMLRLL